MNEMTKLAQENSSNYLQYLERMTRSIALSTKGLIPFFASDRKRILDVGCGSGIVMDAVLAVNPECKVTGIDLNEEDVRLANERRPDLDIRCMDMMNMEEETDCIIFSSVLHEVSSYAETERFEEGPVVNMLKKANSLLSEHGKLIIRDGLADESDEDGFIRMADPKEQIWIRRFCEESPAYRDMKYSETVIDGQTYYQMPRKAIQEFLCTYTWGEASWPREIREKFGIFDRQGWNKVIRKAGFIPGITMTAVEEYRKYLYGKAVLLTKDHEEYFPEAFTTLIVAEKR